MPSVPLLVAMPTKPLGSFFFKWVKRVVFRVGAEEEPFPPVTDLLDTLVGLRASSLIFSSWTLANENTATMVRGL